MNFFDPFGLCDATPTPTQTPTFTPTITPTPGLPTFTPTPDPMNGFYERLDSFLGEESTGEIIKASIKGPAKEIPIVDAASVLNFIIYKYPTPGYGRQHDLSYFFDPEYRPPGAPTPVPPTPAKLPEPTMSGPSCPANQGKK
jgi:hypothetical protein